jgi:MFS family permease
LSLFLTSICKKYYEFLLCQGVLGGLSCGLVYNPAATVIGHYFQKKRPMIMGVVVSGSALAGILFPIILDQLLNKTTLGFGWTQRIVAFIVLPLALIAALTIRPGVPPRVGTYLLPEAFQKGAYSFQVAGLFFVAWGIFTPFFYLPSYAQQHGMSVQLSFYLISILNSGSFVGRLLAGGFGAKVGPFNVLAFCCAVCSILIFCWLRIKSNPGLIVFALLYGMFSGATIGSMITTLVMVAPHPSQMGTYLGMASGVIGIAALTGTPITGAMLSHYKGYTVPIIFSGVVALFGTFLIVCARFARGPKGALVI